MTIEQTSQMAHNGRCMTNEELLADLKQLIDTRASATERYLDQRIENLRMELKKGIQELRADMDDQFNTVLDAIGERFEVTDARVQDQDKRITRLEQLRA